MSVISNFSVIPIRWLLTVDSEMASFLFRSRVVQYTRTYESGRLFGEDDPSSGSLVVVFAKVK